MLHDLLRNGAAASLMMALALGCEESPTIAGKALASLISSATPFEPYTLGVVSGVALDTRGKPIAGARIWVRPALTTGLLETMTDANGRDEVQGIARIPYRAYAWHQLQYRGKRLCLRLASENPADYDPFVPKEGVTRNFRWQLSGDIAPFSEDKFGADLRVFPPSVQAGSRSS